MLDRAYNLYRLEHHGINLDDHPEYQTFHELGIASPTHQEMADIIIQAIAASRGPRLKGMITPEGPHHTNLYRLPHYRLWESPS